MCLNVRTYCVYSLDLHVLHVKHPPFSFLLFIKTGRPWGRGQILLLQHMPTPPHAPQLWSLVSAFLVVMLLLLSLGYLSYLLVMSAVCVSVCVSVLYQDLADSSFVDHE